MRTCGSELQVTGIVRPHTSTGSTHSKARDFWDIDQSSKRIESLLIDIMMRMSPQYVALSIAILISMRVIITAHQHC
jgi:hypothetical protein